MTWRTHRGTWGTSEEHPQSGVEEPGEPPKGTWRTHRGIWGTPRGTSSLVCSQAEKLSRLITSRLFYLLPQSPDSGPSDISAAQINPLGSSAQ